MIQAETNETRKNYNIAQLRKKKSQFDSLFDPDMHEALLARGERRFSLKALQGALMISLYSSEPRFHIPHELLKALMDIDSLVTKWRCKNLASNYIIHFLYLNYNQTIKDTYHNASHFQITMSSLFNVCWDLNRWDQADHLAINT